jgi:hypothetical protein
LNVPIAAPEIGYRRLTALAKRLIAENFISLSRVRHQNL